MTEQPTRELMVTLIAELRATRRELAEQRATGTIVPAEADAVMTAESLLSECSRRALPVTGDMRVSPDTAAALLGVSAKTLANRRALGEGPEPTRRPAFGSRVSYTLRAISEEIARNIRPNFPQGP